VVATGTRNSKNRDVPFTVTLTYTFTDSPSYTAGSGCSLGILYTLY
jgi:hypothetical protein